MTIEKNINKLQKIVEELESEELAIDSAVEKYTQSVKIATETFEKLAKAEEKITILNNKKDRL